PGMMQGYGPNGGYGPGMMQGYGPGMMQGYGPGAGYGPDWNTLTDRQRQRLQDVQREHQERNWKLMEQMQEEQQRLYRLNQAPRPDYDAIEKSTRNLNELQQKMNERHIQTRKQMQEVLEGDD
ncbi:periplasmic heavy metal sensor, partial [Guyparkeria sp.]|uniref:periplasmic heavy metal sensor n=2 Tax=Guyparkeria sp. TaxID=2035736 RepID=UPI00356711A1